MQEFLSQRRPAKGFGKRGRHFFFSDRDRKILHFLWKWKIASTASIHEVTGRPGSTYSTYKAIERLCKRKYLQAIKSEEHGFWVWQLTEKGFNTIRESLGDLVEEGFLSEAHNHDRHVLAFQLGEWATNGLPMVTHYTEQELRRNDVDNYPMWMPKLKDHRSDGYTRLEGSQKNWIFSFEVELWAKSVSRYETILRFYRTIRDIDHVFWLVGNPLVKDQILRAKTCVRDDSYNFHLFVDGKDYMEVGWDALVTNERSESLGSYRNFIRSKCDSIYEQYLAQIGGLPKVPVHYVPTKLLGKSKS